MTACQLTWFNLHIENVSEEEIERRRREMWTWRASLISYNRQAKKISKKRRDKFKKKNLNRQGRINCNWLENVAILASIFIEFDMFLISIDIYDWFKNKYLIYINLNDIDLVQQQERMKSKASWKLKFAVWTWKLKDWFTQSLDSQQVIFKKFAQRIRSKSDVARFIHNSQ